VASLEACCTLCNGLATASLPCRFFTFRATGKGGGACHPKFSDAGRRSSVGAVSGSSGSAGPPAPPPKPYAGDTPNIVFIIDESTDGRTYNPDPENKTAMFIPNIRKLQERVCCGGACGADGAGRRGWLAGLQDCTELYLVHTGVLLSQSLVLSFLSLSLSPLLSLAQTINHAPTTPLTHSCLHRTAPV